VSCFNHCSSHNSSSDTSAGGLYYRKLDHHSRETRGWDNFNFTDIQNHHSSSRLRLVRYFATNNSTQSDENKQISGETDARHLERGCEIKSVTVIPTKDAERDRNEDSTDTTLRRMFEIARPEWKLIAGATATLGITSSVTLLLPYASGKVLDLAILESNTMGGAAGEFSPTLVAFGLFGLTAVAGAGVYIRSILLTTAGNRIVERVRRHVFASAISQDVAFFDKTKTGDLISRLSSDAQLIQSAVTTQAVSVVRGVVMSAGSAGLLFHASPKLALVSLCSLPPVFLGARYFGRILKEQQTQVQEKHAEATSLAEEVFQGVRTVRQFTAEEYETDRYSSLVKSAHGAAIRAGKAQAAFDATVHVAANGALLGVIGYGGTLVLAGELTAGDLTGFLMYSLLVAGNISGLSSTYTEIMKAAAASGRCFAIMDHVPSIPATFAYNVAETTSDTSVKLMVSGDERQNDSDIVESPKPNTPKIVKPMSIEFRNVNFSYPMRPDASILHDFFLTIGAGEVVSIVGSSGSGKSTIASLLTRLYDVDEDEDRDNAASSEKDHCRSNSNTSGIFVNGTNIRDVDPKWLRHQIGIVPQEPLLFGGSIRDNIQYGDLTASMEQVEEAARMARVTDFAQRFSDGLDTMVGQRGTQLSGGQKQRVAIARTILKNPAIVIFDEATSALDAESEHHVQQAINTVMKGRTVLSIAHRMSTIRESDRIAVLQNGQIIEQGSFDELVSMDAGPFRDLMGRQLTE
jgi:ABC-type multidrug transport system fused ATPase/permease subunit